MIAVAVYLAAALWCLVWTIACAVKAVRLHRRLYPRGIRFVFGGGR